MSVVLVTGGAGYIGSHTCVELLGAGYEVVIADNLVNSKYEAVRRIEKISGKKLRFYTADLTDRAAVQALFAREHIDAVIHFAGLKAVGESVARPVEYYYNNVCGTAVLCGVMRDFGVKRIVFSSSATVYGNDTFPYTEDMPTGDVTNPYGRTKYFIECILRDICASDSGWSAALLRYFNPIGAHPSGLIGEDPSGVPNNLMPYILRVASGKYERLGVFGADYDTPDGTCIRDYIHVVDLAKGHLKALDYMFTHTGAEAFNLGTGRGTSVLQLINTFTRVNGVAVPYTVEPRRAGDLPEYYACADKARDILGWQAELSVEDMCRDGWNWQKNNPDGYGG